MIWRHRRGWLALALFVGVWGLYALTAAPGTFYGDPAEYQFIPAIWGIVHPPGYAFYTLLAGVWQRLFLVGSVAFRTNLLAGAAGAWVVTRVYLIVLELADTDTAGTTWGALLGALVAGLGLAVAPDLWQHSIHANAHIVSVALTMTQLWLLVRWHRDGRDRWLYAFALFAGLGVVQHPITAWGLPACAIFILVCRPRIWREPKTLLAVVGCGLLGLTPWLYFPLRSPMAPFGPTDMGTWAGFLRHATAQGLRVNLFHFGLADQLDRLRVFWTLLRLQYPWPLLVVMVGGVVALTRRERRVALLWGLFLLGHLGFTLNTVQDVMAYLLHPFAALAIALGVGVTVGWAWLARRAPRSLLAVVALAVVLLPLVGAARTFPRISLREWRDPDAFVANLLPQFAGRGEGAALASDWEHLTPFFYHTYVEGETVDPADLRPIYVTAAVPWPEAVFGNLPLGPLYLTNYRREIRDLGFRLRPVGDLWQVLEPPAVAPVTPQYSLADVWVDGRVQLVGYDLPTMTVAQGGTLPVILYGRAATTQTAILMPYARLGAVEQHWATDSRRLTPEWLPGEFIVERYEVFVPYTVEPGTYPLSLGYADLTHGQPALTFTGGATALALGEVVVESNPSAARTARVLKRALTNLGNDIALMDARAQVGLQTRGALWEEPLALHPGQAFHLTLDWRALRSPRTSYTVFIHLIDAGGQPWFGHDYTPLGGAFPTYLWFPKWLEGQQVVDPYRLTLPAETPPGQYWLEVGLYEMGSVRRVPQLSLDGTMTGDRIILGPVQVAP